MAHAPLADRMRPKDLSDVVGQPHLLSEKGVLRRIIESGDIPNMIFFGPPGTGKTTLARLIAARTNRSLHHLNGTNATISDIKGIVGELNTFMAPDGVLIYLDEIQYFNKKQQQSLLEYMESGQITLIASTTENPYFYVYGAILSRSLVFEFKPVPPEQARRAIDRAMGILQEETPGFTLPEDVLDHLAQTCGGDVRRALGGLDALHLAGGGSLEDAIAVTGRAAVKYDRDGDNHYDILSAFQKSIRGSDPDAAVHYLARLIAGGDLPSIIRRTLVTAAEDIGLAYPQAMPIVKACTDAALQVGLPEAMLPLSMAVTLLATAPKSNSASNAIGAAISDVENGRAGEIPPHLRDSSYSGAKKLGRGLEYMYPHRYPQHYVKQQYLPDEIKDAKYYEFGDNKLEQASRKYWQDIKGEEK